MNWKFLFLTSMTYSVDIFLYLGGFFIAFTMCDEKNIKNFTYSKPLNIVKALMYRLFRIWPSYIVVLLFYWKIAP